MAPQGTIIYSGRFNRTLDDKNRITIPSDWRSEAFEGAAFLAVPQTDDDGNSFLAVFPPDKVAEIRAKSLQIPISDIESRQAMASFFDDTNTFKFDKQGRFQITAEHCEHAGITEKALIIGSVDNFFIYNPEVWARVKARAVTKNKAVLRQLGI